MFKAWEKILSNKQSFANNFIYKKYPNYTEKLNYKFYKYKNQEEN